MTIVIYFQQSRYRTFKHYYVLHVRCHLAPAFPKLVSYNRFVELTPRAVVPLRVLSQTFTGEKTGIYFVDSRHIKSCHIKREKQHRVFKGLPQKSRTTIGWFFGFKLQLVINDKGELMAFKLIAGNIDDRKPVPDLAAHLSGKLIGDKGYISKPLFEQLFEQGLPLITRIKKNMKNQLMPLIDKSLLRTRALIGSLNDQLKNIAQVEHTRHRSVWSFLINSLAALIAYSLQPKKPALNLKKMNLLEKI